MRIDTVQIDQLDWTAQRKMIQEKDNRKKGEIKG